jgi:hypothetical protein
MNSKDWHLRACMGMVLMTSGCITDATVELTKAPFDATTQLTNGTTAATSEFVDPLVDFTSSTTPGAASVVPAQAKKRLEVFTASTYDNLRSDISRGSGEYLASLATLAGVPSAQFIQFQSFMQESYGAMFDDKLPSADSTRQIVDIAWAAGYGRVR